MAYIYDIADTWNASGTTFTAIKMNVTDTASNAASLLMDLQVGGSSRFSVTKDGQLNVKKLGSSIDASLVSYELGTVKSGFYFPNGGADVAWSRANSGFWGVGFARCSVNSGSRFSWSASSDPLATDDLKLERDAANTLAQRNGVNAQTVNLYGSYTDASNYRRLTKTMSTGGVAVIKPEGAGTGISGNVLHISGLPTSNPGPGILWNNAGTPAIGT